MPRTRARSLNVLESLITPRALRLSVTVENEAPAGRTTRAGFCELPQERRDQTESTERSLLTAMRPVSAAFILPFPSPLSSLPGSFSHRGSAAAGQRRRASPHPPCGPGWSHPARVWFEGHVPCSYAHPRARAGGPYGARWLLPPLWRR